MELQELKIAMLIPILLWYPPTFPCVVFGIGVFTLPCTCKTFLFGLKGTHRWEFALSLRKLCTCLLINAGAVKNLGKLKYLGVHIGWFYEICMALSLPLEIRYGFKRCGLRGCVWVSSWQRVDLWQLIQVLGLRNTEDVYKVHFWCTCEDIARGDGGQLLWMLLCHPIVWEPRWKDKKEE